jgi:hypothetical protein
LSLASACRYNAITRSVDPRIRIHDMTHERHITYAITSNPRVRAVRVAVSQRLMSSCAAVSGGFAAT